MTIRRTCDALRFDRSTYHYQSRRSNPAFLKKRIREICDTHVRYGYRRVYHISRREPWVVNAKKFYRLYRELACNCATRPPSDGSMLSCARIVPRPSGRTMYGRWTLCTISLRRVASCAS